MNSNTQAQTPVPGETQFPGSNVAKAMVIPFILLFANFSLTGRDATDYAAMMFNTEEFVRCDGKKFNIDKYIQAGAEAYSKCFLYLHSGHKPCFMQCCANHFGVLVNGKPQREIIRRIAFDISPRPYKKKFYRATMYCFSLVPHLIPDIDGKCDDARYIVGCWRQEFKRICKHTPRMKSKVTFGNADKGMQRKM